MSDEAKLRACPWCQQIPQLIFRDDGRIGWRGNCPACESDKTVSPEAMERAIENWNRRPLEDALAAERDALKERVEEFGNDIAKWLREADKWHAERRRLESEQDELRVSDENLRRIIGDAEFILNDSETSDDEKWDALKPLLAKACDGHGWDTASEMAAERDALRERVARLEAALSWYADKRNYVVPLNDVTGELDPCIAELDGGERARHVLGEE